MRITLDYYRILIVPSKADLEQLEQAYRDRLQQETRREYSRHAILCRNKLLEKAYKVLSDPETRAEYDGSFFAPIKADPRSLQNSAIATQTIIATKPVAVNPYLEIEPELLIGALIIFYELAEYEMVLNLGRDYLKDNPENLSRNLERNSVDPNKSEDEVALSQAQQKQDILLCLALSYRELSKEQWWRDEWEQAATYAKMGLEILPQEQPLFFNIRTEIESDLNFLKPYRIQALFAQNNPDLESRSKGLSLLQEMLVQRNGIEGNNNDPSGLNLERFLCFIQQIRTYLTLQEQKELFLAEARRGSHPGSCIAAYSLIAEGYAFKKPDSILQAQQIFKELSHHQNTYWERAVCALLLGQTLESQEAIRQSKETNTVELIKKRSQNAPDLLPGLCFYGEQWLQTEVLPQFSDLKSHQMTLSEYFNDPSVQAYLEKISPVTKSEMATPATANRPISTPKPSPQTTRISPQTNSSPRVGNPPPKPERNTQKLPWWMRKKITANAANSDTHSPKRKSPQESPKLNEVVAQRIEASKTQKPSFVELPDFMGNYDRSKTAPVSTRGNSKTTEGAKRITVVSPSSPHSSTRQSNNRVESSSPRPKTPKVARKKRKKNPTLKNYRRGLLLLIGLVCGVGTLGFVVASSQLKNESREETAIDSTPQPENSPPTIVAPKPDLSVSTTPQSKPEPEVVAKPPATPAVFDRESAQIAIQKWLDSKAAALGQQHQAESLNSILTASLLSQWRARSLHYKQNNIHRQFEHSLKIRSVKVNPENPNEATVEAEVKEVARHYQGGQLDPKNSYDDNLLVSYQLVRQNDSWLIQQSRLLQSL